MKTKGPGDFKLQKADGDGCSVCRELLARLGRFFDMIEGARKSSDPEWLTVEEVARELKISKSIVYRLIRNGELEAVDIVVGNTCEIHQKGHCRVNRSCLDDYLQARKVKPLPTEPTRLPAQGFPKVRNHLGL